MLGYVRFDTARHSCDCCGRTLKAGAVILSDERAYGNACAATALGKPKNDRAVLARIDELEAEALSAAFAPYADARPWPRADVVHVPGATFAVYTVNGTEIARNVTTFGDLGRKIANRLPVVAIGERGSRYYRGEDVRALLP